MHTLICETKDVVFNPFADRQLVQRLQDRGDVIPRLCSSYNTCSSILDRLAGRPHRVMLQYFSLEMMWDTAMAFAAS